MPNLTAVIELIERTKIQIMKPIDLSMTIQPMWRWPVESKLVMDMCHGDPYQVTTVNMSMHSFTHVDTPLHVELGRESINTISLSRLCGPAAIVDLTPVSANQELGYDYLKERAQHVREGDIVLLKTCWDDIRDYTTESYWHDAPYIHTDAVQWLSEQPIKAVGFDFPQDHVIREIPDRHPSPKEMPTHDLILRKGILLIEYLCNLGEINTERVVVYALPLKIDGAEGGCARVIAIEDKDQA